MARIRLLAGDRHAGGTVLIQAAWAKSRDERACSGGAPNQCSVSGQRGDFADDQQRRCTHASANARARQVRPACPVTTRCSGREPFSTIANGVTRRAAVRDQAIAHAFQAGHAHVERQRLPFLRERGPVERVVGSPCVCAVTRRTDCAWSRCVSGMPA